MVVSEEFIEEGANLDNTKVAIDSIKEIKGLMKEYNKLVKNEEYKAAKSKLSQVHKCLDKAEATIRKNEGNIGSAFLGTFAGALLANVRMLPINIINTTGAKITSAGLSAIMSGGKVGANMIVGSTIMGVSSLLAIIKGITALINGIKVLIKDIKEKAKVSDILNSYRAQLLNILEEYRSNIKTMEKNLDKRMKA